MKTQPRTAHAALARVFLFALVSLFAVPAITLAFSQYAMRSDDAEFLQSVQARIRGDSTLSAEEKQRAAEYYREHPLSMACDATAPEDKVFHDRVCTRYGTEWQFHWAGRLARWTLVGGAALLAVALALGALAFSRRSLRYASFVAGWRLMTLSSAAEVVLQGAMVVWLSFWLTGYFWHSYSIKLVAIAGIVAAMAVFYAVYALFRKPAAAAEIEGELIAEADAPRLWERVRQLAARLGTAPPDQIVAGIDTDFFVTESPSAVAGRALRGRTLFVSIPLLRVLETTEADAVLAHELAHLGGGDAESGAALGPKLHQFDIYTWKMREGGLTIVAHYLLRLYRMIFEFALARDSREREYTADRTAAGLTAPSAIVRSLIKISAYSSYRGDVERRLFAQDRQHQGEIGIARFVATGLQPYAGSAAFLEAMKTAGVPHPFDSHPPLAERMRNVGHAVPEAEYGAVVMQLPQGSWAHDIATAAQIEERLWSDYERRFTAQHEYSLAHRYEPSNEEELAIVLRHFPPVTFDLAKGGRVEISHLGMTASANEPAFVSWDEVKALTFDGSKSLVISHHDKGLLGARKTTIKLGGIGKQMAGFRGAIGAYWRRHQIMRAEQASRPA